VTSDTKGVTQNLPEMAKPTDMTIHWKAFEEHFLTIPLVLRFNQTTGDKFIFWIFLLAVLQGFFGPQKPLKVLANLKNLWRTGKGCNCVTAQQPLGFLKGWSTLFAKSVRYTPHPQEDVLKFARRNQLEKHLKLNSNNANKISAKTT
jgi:hypothetical protein